jgi:hypothetical protein
MCTASTHIHIYDAEHWPVDCQIPLHNLRLGGCWVYSTWNFSVLVVSLWSPHASTLYRRSSWLTTLVVPLNLNPLYYTNSIYEGPCPGLTFVQLSQPKFSKITSEWFHPLKRVTIEVHNNLETTRVTTLSSHHGFESNSLPWVLGLKSKVGSGWRHNV